MSALTLPLVLAYGPVAVWALQRSGARGLWTACLAALLLVLVVALALAAAFRVPSTGRLVLYFAALIGPAIVLPTILLWLAHPVLGSGPRQLLTALLASVAGLAVGFVLVVYGLRVW